MLIKNINNFRGRKCLLHYVTNFRVQLLLLNTQLFRALKNYLLPLVFFVGWDNFEVYFLCGKEKICRQGMFQFFRITPLKGQICPEEALK